MNINVAEQTLREFADYFIEVGGIVLVSPEGQLMTPSIGIEENTTMLVAGTLLQISNQIAQECSWSKTEQISLQAKEGYLTMLPCTKEAFILVKTNSIPSRTLKQEIQQIVKKLEAQLNVKDSPSFYRRTSYLTQVPEDSHRLNYSNFEEKADPNFISYCQHQLAEFIRPIASIICQRLLKQNPNLSTADLVEALAQKIPNPQQSQEFQQRISSWHLNSN